MATHSSILVWRIPWKEDPIEFCDSTNFVSSNSLLIFSNVLFQKILNIYISRGKSIKINENITDLLCIQLLPQFKSSMSVNCVSRCLQ